MRKIILMIAAAALFAGCDHNNGAGMQYDTNPDVTKAKAEFSSLEIDWPGGVSPESTSYRITVDRDKFITIYLKFYEDFTLVHECDGTELLDNDTFLTIYNFTQDAELMDMRSTVVDYCVGGAPWTITYTEMGGKTNEFDFMPCGTSTNELHKVVEDMIDFVHQIAEEDIQDCNSGTYAYGETVEDVAPEEPAASEE